VDGGRSARGGVHKKNLFCARELKKIKYCKRKSTASVFSRAGFLPCLPPRLLLPRRPRSQRLPRRSVSLLGGAPRTPRVARFRMQIFFGSALTPHHPRSRPPPGSIATRPRWRLLPGSKPAATAAPYRSTRAPACVAPLAHRAWTSRWLREAEWIANLEKDAFLQNETRRFLHSRKTSPKRTTSSRTPTSRRVKHKARCAPCAWCRPRCARVRALGYPPRGFHTRCLVRVPGATLALFVGRIERGGV
jgi:hypothetical protein